jgi:hypothetical protein
LWAKGHSANDINKEMFPVYGGKCLTRNAVHNWVQKPGKRFADDEVETEARKWLRQESKDFYAAGFDALVKRWNKCIRVGGGYVEDYFFRFEYHAFFLRFTRIFICDLFTDSPSQYVRPERWYPPTRL